MNILFSNTDEDSISSVLADDERLHVRYSVDGRKLPTTEKGINIIRMKDGDVKKIFVK